MGAICYKKANFCDKPPKTVIANCKYKHFYQIMCKKNPFFHAPTKYFSSSKSPSHTLYNRPTYNLKPKSGEV